MNENVNIFLTFVYCVVYRKNLAALSVIQIGPCKDMSREINELLNSIVVHFKKSWERKNVLL